MPGNFDLVWLAVSQEGMALEYASEQLQADRRIVMKALSRDGCALQFAAPELRADLEAWGAFKLLGSRALKACHGGEMSDGSVRISRSNEVERLLIDR